jgi:hypothetical protein
METTFWKQKMGSRIRITNWVCKIQYVNPDHVVYKSDGYNYTQTFPNLRLAYKINDNNKVSVSTTEELMTKRSWFVFFKNMMTQKLSKWKSCDHNLPIR